MIWHVYNGGQRKVGRVTLSMLFALRDAQRDPVTKKYHFRVGREHYVADSKKPYRAKRRPKPSLPYAYILSTYPTTIRVLKKFVEKHPNNESNYLLEQSIDQLEELVERARAVEKEQIEAVS